MARVKGGTTTRRRHKAVLKATKGYRSSLSRRYRVARESLTHALSYSTSHRKLKKRTNRSLQIIRINAAAKINDISYSNLIHGISLAGVGLDRKTLSDLAINDPDAFKEIVTLAKDSLN
ncbi:MAG: 50S ribosomal protein L20 [Chloroflexi bacterium]|nr:50S ribosomal protein L20 [Chloroflexota bacterium]